MSVIIRWHTLNPISNSLIKWCQVETLVLSGISDSVCRKPIARLIPQDLSWTLNNKLKCRLKRMLCFNTTIDQYLLGSHMKLHQIAFGKSTTEIIKSKNSSLMMMMPCKYDVRDVSVLCANISKRPWVWRSMYNTIVEKGTPPETGHISTNDSIAAYCYSEKRTVVSPHSLFDVFISPSRHVRTFSD